jgi:four helix bundle protein
MPHNKAFRDLQVWQRSMDLVERIYVSVPSNIGEGSRRKKRKAFLNHLDIALGSQADVDVQLEIARRLRFLKIADYNP